jgi:hypothetical protein
MTIIARITARSTRVMMLSNTAFMGTDLNSPDNRWLLDAMAAADPGYLFPLHIAGSVSADHSDVHRGLAPRAVTS